MHWSGYSLLGEKNDSDETGLFSYFSMIKVDMFTYIYIYIYIYECVRLVKCFDCPFKSTAKFHCCGPLIFSSGTGGWSQTQVSLQ